MLRVSLVAVLFGMALVLPAPAAHAGPWSTWLKMVTMNDMIPLRDTVWIATGEAGVLRYLRSERRFESLTREPGGLASNNVNVITFDRSGRLWAGTAGNGVSRLAADASKWDLLNAFDGLPSDSVNVLSADGDTVWVGTTRGLALWNGHVVAGSVPDIGTASPFRDNRVTGIVVQGDTLFVSTGDGIWQARLSEQLGGWTEVDAGIPFAAIDGLASNRQRLFALAGGIVYVKGVADGTWTVSLSDGHMDKLREDFGVVLADSPSGLFRWTGSNWLTVAGAFGSGSGTKSAEFGADPDGVLFNAHPFAGALELLEDSTGTWVRRKPPGPVSNDILNVMHDGRYVWLTTDAGTARFDGTTWRNFTSILGTAQDTSFVNPANAILLQRDLSGHIWVSNWDAAIERIDESTNPMQFDHVFVAPGAPGTPENAPTWGWASTVDPWGYVYIGGDTNDRGNLPPNGIDLYDPNGSRMAHWTAATTGMADNQVRGLAVDRLSVLWAGFAGAGVSWAKIDTLGTVPLPDNNHLKLPRFHAVQSLVNAVISGVVAHGDSVWVLTSSDLQRLRPDALNPLVSSHYDIAAGPAPRGAVHPLDVSPDGTVWVGSVDGLRRYSPGGGTSLDYRTSNSPLADNEVRSVFVERATGAVWIATAAGLNRFDPHYQPPAPPAIASLQMRLWPNPASLTAMGVRLRLAANTPSVQGEVIDLNGRVMRRFSGIAPGGLVWDGRDRQGALVPPGVYFVHANGGGREAMARVVVLR